MIKKIAVKVGVLTAVFIAAVMFFSYLTNQGNTDMSADMGGATLPWISFTTEGYEVNAIPGYKTDMAVTSLRDTVTPVTNQKLQMNLKMYDAAVEKVSWQVFTLNGEECLQQETIKDVEKNQTLIFKGDGILDEERILKVILHLESQDVFYYTRVKDSAECNYRENLKFVQNFQKSAMKKEDIEKLTTWLEPNASGDNTTYQTVTIHSDITHVTWGDLRPQIQDEIRWEIKECNEAYTSVLLNYRVKCAGVMENPQAFYQVKEFFRVRKVNDKMYLLGYNRTMNQYFDGKEGSLNQEGILLGMAPENLEYKNNAEGTIVSFVQNNELWNYNKEADELSLVFSFADAEGVDERNFYDRHEVHIVSVDKNGNTTFTVSGYMNRGTHEGHVGVAVYYYDSERNSVAERAFVPSIKGYYVMKGELGKFVYFSNKNEKLYVMVDGMLYMVDLVEDTRKVLVRGLEEGQYKVAEDGHLLAYQDMGGKLNESQKITVLNLESGASFEVTAQGEEYLKPIGFIKEDFVYGTLRQTDAGKTNAGQKVYPMYKVEIVNQKQEVVKEYQVADTFILDGYVDENMLTLNRVVKQGSSYKAVNSEYIMNNDERVESNIMRESYFDSSCGTVMRLTYEDGIGDSEAKLLKPKQVLTDKPMNISFDESAGSGKYYVYAFGELQAVYERAGYAVRKAEDIEGVAVSSRQAYIYEKGNVPTLYEVDNMEEFSAKKNESTLAACLRKILEFEGQHADVVQELKEGKSLEEVLTVHSGGEGLDLTGCTIEEIMYTISRETPVIAVLSDGEAVLLIGYNKEKVAYLDPGDGKRYSVPKQKMEEMVKASGNTFIGYAK